MFPGKCLRNKDTKATEAKEIKVGEKARLQTHEGLDAKKKTLLKYNTKIQNRKMVHFWNMLIQSNSKLLTRNIRKLPTQ